MEYREFRPCTSLELVFWGWEEYPKISVLVPLDMQLGFPVSMPDQNVRRMTR